MGGPDSSSSEGSWERTGLPGLRPLARGSDTKTLAREAHRSAPHWRQAGWSGDLIEPSPTAFAKLKKLYSRKKKVITHNIALCDISGKMKFYESGTHLNNGDTDLLSTLSLTDKQKWESTTVYTETEVNALTWNDFQTGKLYDFINIDAEGYDLIILKQLDLFDLGCSCLCIEHNGKILNQILEEVKKYNMRIISQNLENVILAI